MMMLSGQKLGAALTQAMQLKNVGPKEVADHFGIKPPSVKDWQKKGCIHKRHLGRLVNYFADVVPPSHWGVEPNETMALLSGIMGNASLNVSHQDKDVVLSKSLRPLADAVNKDRYLTPTQAGDTTSQLAPVLAWASLGVDLYKEANDVEAVGFAPVPRGASALVKWFVVEQDFHRFGITKGDMVALDPLSDTDKPEEMKRHVFKTAAGQFILAEYRTLAGGSFEALPDTGSALDKVRHGLVVVARVRGVWEA